MRLLLKQLVREILLHPLQHSMLRREKSLDMLRPSKIAALVRKPGYLYLNSGL
jgi:hypothetical protein